MHARGPLASRNFQLLLGCEVISVLGSGIASVATPFAVLAVHGTASDIGYVSAASMVATMAFLLWGGAVADRLPRHQVIVGADGLSAATLAVFAVLVLTGHAPIWALALLSAVRGAAFGFYMPAAMGLLPQTVPADQLGSANAINRVGVNTAQICGAAAGGLLVALAGPGWGLVANAASFALAAALRAGMRFPALPPVEPSRTLQQLREGWREFSARRWLWAIVLQFALLTPVTFGVLAVLGPLVSSERLHGASSWGTIMTVFACGSVLSGVVMVRYRFRRTLLSGQLAIPLMAPLLFALAIPLPVPLVAAAAFLAGASAEVFSVGWITTMQQEIPPEALSRVSSYDVLGSMGMAPVGTALAGPLATAYGTSDVLTAGGLIVIALAIPILCLRDVQRMRRHTAPQNAA